MPNTPFQRIALMGRRRAQEIPETVRAIRDFLVGENIEVVLETHTGEAIGETALPLIDTHDLHKHADLIVVVGGDGSLINAAHVAIKQNLPVLGVNRGTLGFLTDIAPDELSKIQEVIQGNYQLEPRAMLKTTFTTQNGERLERLALNDVILHQGESPRLIEFNLKVNGEFVCNQRADGLIVATPTGSTAYALSAGGPIVAPGEQVLTVVPMFPHTLSSRPLVLPNDSAIELHIQNLEEAPPAISTDGQDKILIDVNTPIAIERHSNSLQLVHPSDYNYFQTLREKLGWHR